MPVTFSIITPSFNQLHYLKRCVASIRDQAASGLVIRHLVVDGASTDGTPEWLRAEGIAHISEPDGGMYDALNKGLDHFFPEPCTLNPAHYFAWLNADEQYLPGTIEYIAAYSQRHPSVDIVCGDALIVDPAGELLTYWKSLPLRRMYLDIGTLYNLTCGLFFRASIFAAGARFDARYQAIADLVMIRQLLAKGVESACVRRYVAAYTHATSNISNQPKAKEEYRQFCAHQGPVQRTVARVMRAGERFLRAGRKQAFPLEYQLYTDAATDRTAFTAGPVPARWPA